MDPLAKRFRLAAATIREFTEEEKQWDLENNPPHDVNEELTELLETIKMATNPIKSVELDRLVVDYGNQSSAYLISAASPNSKTPSTET